jgi:cellulose synthase/poly-beta-1,6-N-acetylglucosamine synthase-like glycosyltransferase
MLEILAYIALGLALLPALVTAVNLVAFRAPPPPKAEAPPPISLVIPARDEEANIGGALRAALASCGVELEVIVLDDGSTDRTADIVAAYMRDDARLRLVASPPLPRGWCGKQHACHVLASHARHPLLVFVDADVRLAPDALMRIAGLLEHQALDLASGFPEQQTRTLFCNRAAQVKGSKLAPARRLVVWQGPLFCPRSARGAAASWGQARARRINL